MHYIVDGYNLLFRILTVGKDLKEQRQYVIENLNKKIQLLGIRVSIIFDSSYNIDESLKSHYNSLEIQFTSRGITADEWIIERVKRSTHPEKKVVVTSDKGLAIAVRSYLSKTETIEEFIAALNKRYKNKQEHVKEENLNDKIKLKTPLKPLPSKKIIHNTKSDPSISERSFEFYLKAFEDNFNKIVASKAAEKAAKKPPKKPVTQKKHEFPKEQNEDVKYKSEMDRWQALFENDSHHSNKNI